MTKLNWQAMAVGAVIGAGLILVLGAVNQEFIQKVEVTNLPLHVTAQTPLPVKEPVLVMLGTNQWAYYAQALALDNEEALNQALAARGNEGWELITVRSNQFIFKRPIPPTR